MKSNHNSPKRFQNKVVIITGAGSGIGFATAKRFANEGAKIALIDYNEKNLSSAKKFFTDQNNEALNILCDVSKPDQVENTVKKVLDHYGQLDVIVNNAGLMIFKPLQEHNIEDWQKVLAVDLLGSFFFIKQGFLHMKNGSAIVNVSSIHAVETTPLVCSYAAAKAAVVSLTRSAALEGKPKGIRVNAVLPGAIDTPMLWDNPNIKSGLEVISHSDIGKAEDVAAAITYLASDEAAFVCGTELRVDGGRLSKL